MEIKAIGPQDHTAISEVYENVFKRKPVWSDQGGFVIYDKEKPIAFSCLGTILHAGPTWIHKEYRGRKLWKVLFEAINNFLTGKLSPGHSVYVFCGSSLTESICKELGLHETPWKVYRKDY